MDDPLEQKDEYSTFTDHIWHNAALQEARHVTEHVGISHASFSKIRVAGPDARLFLNYMTTNLISKIDNKCRLTYALTKTGRILAEFTVTKEPTEVDSYYIVGSRDYAAHDTAHIRKILAEWETPETRGAIEVTDISSEIDILHVAGPKAKDLLRSLAPCVETMKFLTMAPATIGGAPVNVFRVSFTGCAGFELHFPAEHGPAVHSAIWSSPGAKELNMQHFGGYALNSLRIEKGFKIKSDLDYAHYTEAGIDPFISSKKAAGFLGRMDNEADYTPTKRSVLLKVDTPKGFEWSVPSDVPVLGPCGTVCGYTTTGAFGALTGYTVAAAYLFEMANAVIEGGTLTVELYGELCTATVLDGPPCAVTAK